MKTQIPLFIADMENAATEIVNKVKMTPDEGIPVEDIFDLYREVFIIKQIFKEYCSRLVIILNFFYTITLKFFF